MGINEILEKFKYYTQELPKDALIEARKKKEELTPKLIEMMDYTMGNLDNIVYGNDNFFGYIYAIYLLSEFKEQKLFPYLIELLKQGKEKIEYILGDDYLDYLPRIIASTYNGDDESLFSIIENEEIDEFIRSATLQVFAILYLYEIKDRDFLVEYFRKLLNENEKKCELFLCLKIFNEVHILRLIELEDVIYKTFNNCYIIKKEMQELKNTLKNNNYVINREIYPFKDHYEYIEDVISIMGEWQCFRYKEDEEFENSVNFKKCHQIINKRKNSSNTKIKIGRNEPCICGSGKKYKKCCIYKSNSNFLEDLNFIDQNVSKAIWYLQRNELKKADNLFRIAWLSVKDICIKNNIKSINEYDEKYEGYDFLSNWIQEYDEILEFSDKKSKIYERLDLCNDLEKIFDLKNVNQIYWKEKVIRATANSQFKLGNEKEATRIIEDYLKQNKLWTWGYIEMADWYDDKSNLPYYNLNKAKDILLRAESIENLEDMDRIYERLENIYTKLGDKEKAKEYNIKWQNYDS